MSTPSNTSQHCALVLMHQLDCMQECLRSIQTYLNKTRDILYQLDADHNNLVEEDSSSVSTLRADEFLQLDAAHGHLVEEYSSSGSTLRVDESLASPNQEKFSRDSKVRQNLEVSPVSLEKINEYYRRQATIEGRENDIEMRAKQVENKEKNVEEREGRLLKAMSTVKVALEVIKLPLIDLTDKFAALEDLL
ncbi:unnamed protein product [Meganyctiphanes norvegica]|uniref:Uncharacterized protein n=1 Tax=Meganyctiphanes norvegica TaxID=48144 RepID=A0AAV2SR90_MEGNR